MRLPAALAAWGTPDFAAALARELAAQRDALPLQQAVTATSVALDADVEVMFIGAREGNGRIVAHVGVFFAGIVAGCSCADDPTPVTPQPEYCELEISMDKATAEARCALAAA